MDCSNREMVEDKEYTRKTINNFKKMGYTNKELLEAIKDVKNIKADEILL